MNKAETFEYSKGTVGGPFLVLQSFVFRIYVFLSSTMHGAREPETT